MLRTKTADRIVCIATVVMLIAAVCLWGIVESGQGDSSGYEIGYESLLFDTSRVHTIEITMDNWEDLIANAAAEEYQECTIVIDGENLGRVGIRAKGNTSLSSVATLGSERYSFKVEFDHYQKGKKYHGLDKLSLNNLIQDATMMKDYLAYTLMGKMGVPSSLCSYVQITVNGEPWGLYLAVEGVEDSFMERNGMTKGELYKPDSMSFGGGRGNGRDFDIEKFRDEDDSSGTEDEESSEADSASGFNPFGGGSFSMPEGMSGSMPEGKPGNMPGNMPEGMSGNMPGNMPEGMSGNMPGNMPEGGFSFPGGGSIGESSGDSDGNAPKQPEGGFGGGGFAGFHFGMGSEDVKLVYSDDDPDSYSNIFNNAKTDISSKDKTRLIESLKKLNEGEDLDEVVNQDEVITYLAVHNFLCNDDSYTGMMVHNYYLYEEKGKLSILPWDYNLGFGGFSAGQDATSTINSPIDNPVSSETTDSRPLIAWIFRDDEAKETYHEVYSRFISEWVESGWLEGEITRVQEMIRSFVESDPSSFYTMEEHEKAVSTLKEFCAKRAESVRGQLKGDIPSTMHGQRQNSENLIDASGISTADMGSMSSGNGGNGGGGGFSMPGGGGFTMPENGSGFTMPESSSSSGFPGGNFPSSGTGSQDFGNFQGFENTEQPAPSGMAVAAESDAKASGRPEASAGPAAQEEKSASRPPAQEEKTGRPEGFPGGFPGETENHSDQWIMFGACVVLLLAVTLIIWRTKAHNS